MPEIHIIHFGENRIEIHEVDKGSRLVDGLIDISPDKWDGKHVAAVIDKCVYDQPEVINNVYCTEDKIYEVLVAPAGGVKKVFKKIAKFIIPALVIGAAIAFLPGVGAAAAAAWGALSGSSLGLLAAGVALSALSSLALSRISLPELPGIDSPSNSVPELISVRISGNRSRLSSRIPDHFGQTLYYPDTIIPTYTTWTGTVQNSVTFFCVGTGSYQIDEERLSSSPLDSFTGVTTEYRGPSDPAWTNLPVSRPEQVLTGSTPDRGDDTFTQWSVIPGINTRIELDVSFPQGAYILNNSNGNESAVMLGWELEYRPVGSAAAPLSFTFSQSFNDEDPQRNTYGVDVPAGLWEVRWRRDANTEASGFTNFDTQRLERVVGIEYIDQSTHGKYTIVRVEITNDDMALSNRDTRFSVVTTRLLPSLRPDGTFTPPVPTRSVVDAIHFTLTDPSLGNYPSDQIDIDDLVLLKEKLQDIDSGEAELYNGSFLSRESAEQQLSTLTNPARINVFREGSTFRFGRDEVQGPPVAVFNRRNKGPQEDRGGFVFSSEEQYDAVVVRWWDQEDDWNWKEYTYPEGVSPVNPLSTTLSGATTWSQAWRFATWQWNTMRYRRRTLETSLTEEAQLVRIFDVVSVADNISSAEYDGEVRQLFPATLTVRLDQTVFFDPAAPAHTIVFRRKDGLATDEIECTPGVNEDEIVLQRLPIFPIEADGRQITTLYNFGTRDQQQYGLYQVLALDISNDYVGATMAAYDEKLYEFDGVLPPPKPV